MGTEFHGWVQRTRLPFHTDAEFKKVDLEERSELYRRIAELIWRLIADVVTGKLDVREAAANLPDELDDNGPVLDDSDEMEDHDDLPDEEADE